MKTDFVDGEYITTIGPLDLSSPLPVLSRYIKDIVQTNMVFPGTWPGVISPEMPKKGPRVPRGVSLVQIRPHRPHTVAQAMQAEGCA